jgi:hypothetical protein
MAVRKCFRFLEDEYGFGVVEMRNEPHYAFVAYVNKTTGVEVHWELRDSRVYIHLARLVDGVIPSTASYITLQTPLHVFNLFDLLQVRHVKPKYVNAHSREFKSDLEPLALQLKANAGDVLRGDFTIFTELETIARERIREWENRGPTA